MGGNGDDSSTLFQSGGGRKMCIDGERGNPFSEQDM